MIGKNDNLLTVEVRMEGNEGKTVAKMGDILGYLLIAFFVLVIFTLPWSVGVVTIFRFFAGL